VHRQLPGSSFKGVSARSAIAASLLSLVSCGGSSNNPALTLSGTVSGLTTDGLALTSNGVNLDISSGAKTFTFGPVLSDGIVYDVTVPIQPSGQVCSVTNGTGTAATANISNVVVTCSNRTFTVGGTITGLTAPGLVLANGSDTLSVPAAATSFTMPTGVAFGSAYAVTVATQPTGLTCNVTSGTGTVAAEAVTNIAVTCSAKPLTVGGTISGLGSATGLVLVNGTDTYKAPSGATSFTLDAPQSPGGTYTVHVHSQPAGLTCSASNAPGSMPTHDVTDVSIVCSEEAYGLGGTVVGLTAAGLVLSDGDHTYPVPANAADFTMPEAVASGSPYRVSVLRQPAGLTCTVSDGSGTMPARTVAEVAVTCAAISYTLGGSISGLTRSGLVLTDGEQTLEVSANARQFSMPDALADGARYALSIQVQPSGANCQVTDGTGTVTTEVESVRVTCESAAPAP
jgi:RNase P/RNase MRP subunit p29